MNRLPIVSRLVSKRMFSSRAPAVIPPLDPNTIPLRNFTVPYPQEIQQTFSIATACQKDITNHRIDLAIAKFQRFEGDTGSSAVQIAILTEKIYNLARHHAMHKKDNVGKRGFQVNILK